MLVFSRKPEPANVQGTCTVLGCTNAQKSKGGGKYRALCRKHFAQSIDQKQVKTSEKYRLSKKTYCEDCGPDVKYHPCQLDVDHSDGNHKNNDPENHKTRCANCHRLKTWKAQQLGLPG